MLGGEGIDICMQLHLHLYLCLPILFTMTHWVSNTVFFFTPPFCVIPLARRGLYLASFEDRNHGEWHTRTYTPTHMLQSTCTYTHTHTHTLPTLTGHAKNTTLVLDRRASVREPNSQALEGFLRHSCEYIHSRTWSPTVIAPRTSSTSSHTDTSRMQTQFKSYPPDGRASTLYTTAASHILTECCVYSVVGERVGGGGGSRRGKWRRVTWGGIGSRCFEDLFCRHAFTDKSTDAIRACLK